MLYEINFVKNLAELGRVDLIAKFVHVFRYIDDLCWLNVTDAHYFLSQIAKNNV